ncbi:MAG TPA: pyruvate, water dikinase regulatory protein [Anaerolineales bacterium]|nr:pyruvate, water dikinase regulatory protein [Anaerolineales bacterium]
MFHIFAVSDGTGTTAERVVRAALVQFEDHQIQITRCGGVRSATQIREIIAQAVLSGGFVVHTLVYEELRHVMFSEGRANNITTIDLMGPLLARLSELLSIAPRSEPGLFLPFDSAYYSRIEAIDYTVRHDDGRGVSDLDQAEIVLVGISRTSKTPLSIYLAYRGWKVANVPLALGLEPPAELFDLPRGHVVGLVVRPERLAELRQARLEKLGTKAWGYADLDHIKKETAYAYRVFERRRDWPLVDVTSKPIEEAAAEVVTLLGKPGEMELPT